MSAPTFGMTFTRPDDEPVPVLGADFSKALIIETSEDADDAAFPVDTPVRISTNDTTTTAKLGTGLLADAVTMLNAQIAYGADVVIYRVAEGADADETIGNIATALGNVAAIPPAVGMTPRLIWAGRTAVAQTDTGGQPIVNGVVAALPDACNTLLAIAVVDVDDTSSANAIAAREDMNSDRLMPVGVAARILDANASVVTRPMGPNILGLFMRIDNAHGGKPFDPIANEPLYGLSGLSRTIPFSLLDGSTEGQQMLESNVSIVVHGEKGVDSAASDGGFQFIGTDGAGSAELWRQIHQVRGADYLTVKLIQITREFLGKKITADLVEAWLNSQKFMLRDHAAAGDILGYDVQFKADANSPEQIRLGHLTVNLGIEPTPAFKLADHQVRRYRPAVDALVAEIIAKLNSVS